MSVPQSFQQWQRAMDPLYGGWRDRAYNLSTGGMMLYKWFYPYGPGVIMLPPEYIGNGYWQLRWMSNRLPPVLFYVWVNGQLATTTASLQTTIRVPESDSAEVFVYDSATDQPPGFHPRALDIFWLATADTRGYRVEQYIGGAWKVVHRQTENGASSYEFRTLRLADETTHQLRVIAVGESENETTLNTMSVLMVGRPDHETLGWSYDDGTQMITIASG